MTASTTTVTMRPIASGFSPAAAVVVVTSGSNSARHAARLVMPRCTTVTMTISAPFPPEDADARRDEQERRQQRRNRRVQAVPGIGEPERGREQENHQRATLGAGERRVDRALGDGTVLEARRA